MLTHAGHSGREFSPSTTRVVRLVYNFGTATYANVGYLALGVLMNAISRSKLERFIMTPVALVLAILALVVALGR